MTRRVLLVIALTATGCESSTEPTELASFYQATSVDGAALPARGIDVISNSAGTCELDLESADLMFNGARFDFYLGYNLRCTGADPVRTLARQQGEYTRTGTSIEFHPDIGTSDSMEGAEIRGRNVFVLIRRNNGTEFEIRFAPG